MHPNDWSSGEFQTNPLPTARPAKKATQTPGAVSSTDRYPVGRRSAAAFDPAASGTEQLELVLVEWIEGGAQGGLRDLACETACLLLGVSTD